MIDEQRRILAPEIPLHSPQAQKELLVLHIKLDLRFFGLHEDRLTPLGCIADCRMNQGTTTDTRHVDRNAMIFVVDLVFCSQLVENNVFNRHRDDSFDVAKRPGDNLIGQEERNDTQHPGDEE